MVPTSAFHKAVAIIVAILTGGYMAPWAVAVFRQTGNTTAVFWLDLLVGWTIIGWVIALVMSLKSTDPYPSRH